MKSLRYIKLRTFCRNQIDLATFKNYNPLKQEVPISPDHAWTSAFLERFQTPETLDGPSDEPSVLLFSSHVLQLIMQPFTFFLRLHSMSYPLVVFYSVFSHGNTEGWLAWKQTI